MLLRYYDRHGIIGHMGAGGMVRLEPVESMPWASLEGVFALVGGQVLALYRHEHLFIRLGRSVIQLDGANVSREVQTGLATLTVERSGSVEVFGYELPPIDPPLSDDPTPHVEEEDFDLGLFIANVANDPDRAERLYRTQEAS